jgi:hypothetical protein
MRPINDWFTSTLSTFSMCISAVSRRMKPRLRIMRRSVIAISVVQRSNQARKSRNRLSARRINPTAIAGQGTDVIQTRSSMKATSAAARSRRPGRNVVHEILHS